MKNPLRLALISVLALAALGPVAALTVSVAPAQTLVAGAEGTQPPPLESFMSGCLDGLFDAGFIATNAPAREIDRARWSDAAFGLVGAKEGYIDYVVAVFLTWQPSKLKKEVWRAIGCEYRIVRVSDGKVMVSGSAKAESDDADLIKNPEGSARSMGTDLGKTCAALITGATTSNGGE